MPQLGRVYTARGPFSHVRTPFDGIPMKPFPVSLLRRSLQAATMALVLAAPIVFPAQAATPKDTLVVAFAFDDIITMDPAESFEISAGEIMGNVYDRLVRFDIDDPSRLLGDVARTWTVPP